MLKRALIGIALALALLAIGKVLWVVFASDETRIRWVLESMEEGFNAPDVGDMLAGLSEGFTVRRKNSSRSVSRDKLAMVLRGQVLREVQGLDSGRPRHVVLVDDSIEISTDEKRAQASLELRFFRDAAPESLEVGHVRIRCELSESEEGWTVDRAEYELLSGTASW